MVLCATALGELHMTSEELMQIVYSIDRAIQDNQRLADALFEAGDYQAEVPEGDAENLIKAKQLLLERDRGATKMNESLSAFEQAGLQERNKQLEEVTRALLSLINRIAPNVDYKEVKKAKEVLK